MVSWVDFSKSRQCEGGLGVLKKETRNEMSCWCWHWFSCNASLRPRALLSFWKSTKSLENEVLGLPTRESSLVNAALLASTYVEIGQ